LRLPHLALMPRAIFFEFIERVLNLDPYPILGFGRVGIRKANSYVSTGT
jgi:hypothetical protein